MIKSITTLSGATWKHNEPFDWTTGKLVTKRVTSIEENLESSGFNIYVNNQIKVTIPFHAVDHIVYFLEGEE